MKRIACMGVKSLKHLSVSLGEPQVSQSNLIFGCGFWVKVVFDWCVVNKNSPISHKMPNLIDDVWRHNKSCCDCVAANTPPVHPTIEFRACALQPCQHGGSCLDTSHGSFSCQCKPQWKGSHCEDPVVHRGKLLLSEYYCILCEMWSLN